MKLGEFFLAGLPFAAGQNGECPCDRIRFKSISQLSNLSGYYFPSGLTHNGLPVYAHTSGQVKMFFDNGENQWLVGWNSDPANTPLGKGDPQEGPHCPGEVNGWSYLFGQSEYRPIENEDGINDQIYCSDDDDPNCCDILKAQGLDDMDGFYYRDSKLGFDGSYLYKRYSDDSPPTENGYVFYKRNIPDFFGVEVADRWEVTSSMDAHSPFILSQSPRMCPASEGIESSFIIYANDLSNPERPNSSIVCSNGPSESTTTTSTTKTTTTTTTTPEPTGGTSTGGTGQTYEEYTCPCVNMAFKNIEENQRLSGYFYPQQSPPNYHNGHVIWAHKENYLHDDNLYMHYDLDNNQWLISMDEYDSIFDGTSNVIAKGDSQDGDHCPGDVERWNYLALSGNFVPIMGSDNREGQNDKIHCSDAIGHRPYCCNVLRVTGIGEEDGFYYKSSDAYGYTEEWDPNENDDTYGFDGSIKYERFNDHYPPAVTGMIFYHRNIPDIGGNSVPSRWEITTRNQDPAGGASILLPNSPRMCPAFVDEPVTFSVMDTSFNFYPDSIQCSDGPSDTTTTTTTTTSTTVEDTSCGDGRCLTTAGTTVGTTLPYGTCPCDRIKFKYVLAYDEEQHKVAALAGYFSQSGQTHNDLPVYDHTGGVLTMFFDKGEMQWIVSWDMDLGAIKLAYGDSQEGPHCPGNVNGWWKMTAKDQWEEIVNHAETEMNEGINDNVYCADDDEPNCCDILEARGLDDMDGYYYRSSRLGYDGSYVFRRYSDDATHASPETENGYLFYKRNIPDFFGYEVPDRWEITTSMQGSSSFTLPGSPRMCPAFEEIDPVYEVVSAVWQVPPDIRPTTSLFCSNGPTTTTTTTTSTTTTRTTTTTATETSPTTTSSTTSEGTTTVAETACPCDRIRFKSISYLTNLSGFYSPTGQTHNGLPVYDHTSGQIVMFFDIETNQWVIGWDMDATPQALAKGDPQDGPHCPGEVNGWSYYYGLPYPDFEYRPIVNEDGINDQIYCSDNDDPNCCDILKADGLDDMDGFYYRHKSRGYDGSYLYKRYSDDSPPTENGYIFYKRNIPDFWGYPVDDRWEVTSSVDAHSSFILSQSERMCPAFEGIQSSFIIYANDLSNPERPNSSIVCSNGPPGTTTTTTTTTSIELSKMTTTTTTTTTTKTSTITKTTTTSTTTTACTTTFHWKGGKISKLLYEAEPGMAQLRVNFKNNSPYSLTEGPYHGFLSFAKKKCGPDFLTALVDGRVSWTIFDYGKFYQPQYVHKRDAGRHSVTTLQFWRSEFGESLDLPEKGTRVDQLLLFLSGLDQVDFESYDKDLVTCLQGVYGGTAEVGQDPAEFRARCAAEDKDLGW